MERAIDACVDDVHGILARDGTGERGLTRLVERMGALVRDPDVLAAHEAFLAAVSGTGDGLYTDTGRRSQVLRTDATGLTLVRSRFDPGEPTPIHSHGTWGIVDVAVIPRLLFDPTARTARETLPGDRRDGAPGTQ